MPEYLKSFPHISKRVCAGPGKPGSSEILWLHLGKGYWSWEVLEICYW